MSRDPGTRFGLAVIAALAVIVLGVWWFWAGPFGTTSRPDKILLISIDTCRADHLSCYGYPHKTTPNIDAIAQEGFLFRNVISPVPVTLPAHCSLLTGTLPPYHGVHGNISYRLRDSNVTLAEVLRNNGYATGAVIGSFPLDPRFGLSQGFDFYDAQYETGGAPARFDSERRAGEVNSVAVNWLEEHAGGRFFLFMHYFDPHEIYRPPRQFASKFPHNPYAGEIAYVDHCIGEIINKLKQLGIYDSTMIIVTADHGESLGEHGEPTHGYFIYHSTTRVPLVIKLPNNKERRVVDQKVALVDVFPTVLELAGVSPATQLHGESLVPLLKGGNLKDNERRFYSESLIASEFGCSPLLGLETQRWKYIQTTRPELYDLLKDPGESTNVLSEHPDQARLLKEHLTEMLRRCTRTTDRQTAAPVADPESIERLESLGYVQGTMPQTMEFDTEREDPKDFHPFFLKIGHATKLSHAGGGAARGGLPWDQWSGRPSPVEQAKRICEEILAERPDIARAHALLGRMAVKEGDQETAAFHYSNMLKIEPQSAVAHFELGKVRMRQGRLEEAVTLLTEALRLNAPHDAANSTVDTMLSRLGRWNQVTIHGHRYLGESLYRMGRIEHAAKEYRESLRTYPHDAKAYYVIGLAAAAKGDYDQAVEAFREAVRIKPDYTMARRALDASLARAAAPVSP